MTRPSAVEMAGRFLLGAVCFIWDSSAPSMELNWSWRRRQAAAASHPALALFVGPISGVFCHSYLSHLYWQLWS